MIVYVPIIILLSFAALLVAADAFGRKPWEDQVWEAVAASIGNRQLLSIGSLD